MPTVSVTRQNGETVTYTTVPGAKPVSWADMRARSRLARVALRERLESRKRVRELSSAGPFTLRPSTRNRQQGR
jgi:hypothetical protein